MTKSLFIFRRDLRVFDNTGLLEAARQSGEVVVCFIYDETILAGYSEGDFRLEFLHASLMDLSQHVPRDIVRANCKLRYSQRCCDFFGGSCGQLQDAVGLIQREASRTDELHHISGLPSSHQLFSL